MLFYVFHAQGPFESDANTDYSQRESLYQKRSWKFFLSLYLAVFFWLYITQARFINDGVIPPKEIWQESKSSSGGPHAAVRHHEMAGSM